MRVKPAEMSSRNSAVICCMVQSSRWISLHFGLLECNRLRFCSDGTQAGLNSGSTDLRAKSPNLNFEKARIKKLGFQVMKVIKSYYYRHLLQDITTNQQLSRRMPPKTTSFNRADHGVRDY